MLKNSHPTEPFSAIIFDCDGTLSSIEGIDYLAELRGVYKEVSYLTHEAMAHTGLTPALYQKRLAFVKPSKEDIQQLGCAYCEHLMPNAFQVISALSAQKKSIYIVSAGLQPAVEYLAIHLNIPLANVKAVNIFFDVKHAYQDFDLNSPLIHNQGKATIVKEIQKKHPRILYVGDGLNDLAVKPYVSRFVGFGGAFFRENIKKESDFYITGFAALLPLALTAPESAQLSPGNILLYEHGKTLL